MFAQQAKQQADMKQPISGVTCERYSSVNAKSDTGIEW